MSIPSLRAHAIAAFPSSSDIPALENFSITHGWRGVIDLVLFEATSATWLKIIAIKYSKQYANISNAVDIYSVQVDTRCKFREAK